LRAVRDSDGDRTNGLRIQLLADVLHIRDSKQHVDHGLHVRAHFPVWETNIGVVIISMGNDNSTKAEGK
jgi:hypothetical protein